jgi:hypothetical protein
LKTIVYKKLGRLILNINWLILEPCTFQVIALLKKEIQFTEFVKKLCCLKLLSFVGKSCYILSGTDGAPRSELFQTLGCFDSNISSRLDSDAVASLIYAQLLCNVILYYFKRPEMLLIRHSPQLCTSSTYTASS